MKITLTRKVQCSTSVGETSATIETDDLDFLGHPTDKYVKFLKDLLPEVITVPHLPLSNKEAAKLKKEIHT